ncbi:hypothetical protein TWF730_008478 [Orbilia blumenaviensis]|uniref:Aminotransferase class I/classII large domain-containing protein n=1 Tax=Orbilia blumenaviensis TaxID=1796055 RepID=A0AAV9V397_9PEZI
MPALNIWSGLRINLAIAENSLMQQVVADYLNENLRLQTKQLTYGDGTSGSHRLKTNLATFVNDYFHPVKEVAANQIIISTGVGGSIDQISWGLCNEGDGILVGKPVYSGFIQGMEKPQENEWLWFLIDCRANAAPVSFGDINPFSVEALQCYERELVDFNQRNPGVQIRALLLANPHNPLGKCYPREVLIEYLKFCECHDIHLIIDEIYAMSIFKTSSNQDATEFHSILSIDIDRFANPLRVHVLYGMSKDFSSNGLRLGIVISRNPDLIAAMSTITVFSWPSAPADLAWCIMLEDRTFLKYYISEHQKRLGQGYEFLAGILDNFGIDYVRGSNAGFFIWADFSFALEKPTDGGDPGLEEDMKLDERIIKCGVHLAAGFGYLAEKPGWFRITFSQPRPLLLLGIAKMMKLLKGVDIHIDLADTNIVDPQKNIPADSTYSSLRSSPEPICTRKYSV